MNVNFDANASRWTASLRTQTEPAAKSKAASAAQSEEQTDQVLLSSQGQPAAVRRAEPFSKLETAVRKGDLAAIAEAAKEKAGQLEINWNEVVDPGGQIYSKTYVESLLGQYEKASATIEAYYAKAHQENLAFDNPHAHILQKYRISDSPYFQSDMAQPEREMAFRQERALLWGDHVALNDPYAMASSGGALYARDADQIARQAAQDKVDELIRARKEAADLQED